MWSTLRNSQLRVTHRGFTLIELVVVSAVAVLLLSGAVVAYNSFFRRQSSFASSQEVLSVMRIAQSRARSGVKPASGCATLTGYRVSGSQGGTNYLLQVVCDGAIVPTETVSYDLKASETFTSTFAVTFPSLPGSVGGGAQAIGITQLGNQAGYPRFEFRVTNEGVIEEGSYLREAP